MKVVYATGIEGARRAQGIAVVIDVLRAFTVSAYALAGGARECLLVPTVDAARALAAEIPDAFISAEVDTLPVPGIAISNSPTQIAQADCKGRTLVQRTSAGTPVINAVGPGHDIYAASLVVAGATAQACLLRDPEAVTVIASADFPEDHACARYIGAMLTGMRPLPAADLLRDLYASDRYRRFAGGDWPGFPRTDLELALEPDRFDFAMPATRERGYVRLTSQR
ncbi:MAG TPA: 2-phosphosulfolactate phosphatase [Candidatus Dormibacteraeota bacterium]|nr:2-phosphosulfolactate phosphatase [Candidatus Dormibacteraeota bacterium]